MPGSLAGPEQPRVPLRALIVEDCPEDATLLLHALRRGGYDVSWVRVQDATALREALASQSWDIVLSDYSMPSFSAPDALTIVRETGRDLPFIIVSGTIGEEAAVSALKAGACDFLVKGRLARFIPAVERELREVAVRRERARTQAALEEQLRQSQKMEAIGQLAGGIAHDFNNLLTAILGYCELLTDQIGPDKPIGRDLQEITAAAEKAASLTRQLLAFSRKQVLTIQPIELNGIISDLVGLLKRLIGERITITLALDDQLPAVMADATQLEQVLMNLCVNARDAMPLGGTLTIRTQRGSGNAEHASSDQLVTLTVTDTGTGISPEIRSKIFEPFFTTKERGRGTGLGLSAVHGIVSQLGGSIAVDSEVGKGTTFVIQLPASEDAMAKTAVTRARAKPVGGETILLVEDEPGVRSFVRIALERFGYRVVEAETSEDALTALAGLKQSVDLLLTDLVLQGMSGHELAARIKELSPGTRILYMSGYSQPMGDAHSPFDPAILTLEKPFTTRTLLERIRQVFDEAQPSRPGHFRETEQPSRTVAR
jgi:two-component system, cell cycle sensor histidine kinase and response regulator CckA